jgi:GDP-4-dehydro-6-deoxy-D-mannose reductase
LRAFVTGAEGFAGSHLTELLLKRGTHTFGTYFDEAAFGALPDTVAEAELAQCDVRDHETLDRTVSEANPDTVFHLAAVASVSQSARNPALTIETNITGSCNLLNAVRDNAPEARIVMISSAEVYGNVTSEQLPLREDAPVEPINLYGVTKASVELLSKLYIAAYGMDIVILRPFNHVGPRQSPSFVSADFASQIAKIELGLIPPRIEVGDIAVERDFTDVRDMVKGYLAAAEKGGTGDTYNLCSGQSYRIENVLDILISFAEVPIEIHRDAAKRRATDVPVLVGTADKFEQATAWSAQTPLATALLDTLNYWRENVRSTGGS